MTGAYYNEIDPFCVEWLHNLISAGLIPAGDVDSRSIEDVTPDDLAGYAQCHFFAGLGGWAYAARLAGWPDERPLWTGSCPCQPFSGAGKGGGTDDPRHLWPHLYRVVRGGRPIVLMGEQVAGALGYDWFDGVHADLAAEGYEARAVDIPAASVNAPHRRNRLYWVAYANQERHERGREARDRRDGSPNRCACGGRCCSICGPIIDAKHAEFMRIYPLGFDDPAYDPFRISDTNHEGLEGWRDDTSEYASECAPWARGADYAVDGLSDAAQRRRREERADASGCACGDRAQGWTAGLELGGAWDDWQLIGPDRDGKYRRIKPGITPLAARLPGHVGQLRAYGNAINAELAAEVIRAWMDVTTDQLKGNRNDTTYTPTSR